MRCAPGRAHPPVSDAAGFPPGSCPQAPPSQGRECGWAGLSSPRLPAPRAPRVPSAARRWKSMSVCSVQRDRLLSRALLLAGKGGGKKGSLRARRCTSRPPAEPPARCRSGGSGGWAGWQGRGDSRTPGRGANRTAGQLGGTPGLRAMRLMKAQRQRGRAAGRSPSSHVPPDRAVPGLAPPRRRGGAGGARRGQGPRTRRGSAPSVPREQAASGNGRARGGGRRGTRDGTPRPREERYRGRPHQRPGA